MCGAGDHLISPAPPIPGSAAVRAASPAPLTPPRPRRTVFERGKGLPMETFSFDVGAIRCTAVNDGEARYDARDYVINAPETAVDKAVRRQHRSRIAPSPRFWARKYGLKTRQLHANNANARDYTVRGANTRACGSRRTPDAVPNAVDRGPHDWLLR